MEREYWKAGNMLYPVPAVMISCQRPGERPNIITVAWTGTICSDPAMVSISVRKERYSNDLTFATDYCGVKSGKDVDKFKEMNLTPSKSKTISAPGISESPVSLECKVKQVLELGSHDMFLAEVTAVSVDPKYMDEKGKFHLNDIGLTAYSHGEYFKLGEKIGSFGYSVKKK